MQRPRCSGSCLLVVGPAHLCLEFSPGCHGVTCTVICHSTQTDCSVLIPKHCKQSFDSRHRCDDTVRVEKINKLMGTLFLNTRRPHVLFQTRFAILTIDEVLAFGQRPASQKAQKRTDLAAITREVVISCHDNAH